MKVGNPLRKLAYLNLLRIAMAYIALKPSLEVHGVDNLYTVNALDAVAAMAEERYLALSQVASTLSHQTLRCKYSARRHEKCT